MSKSAHRSKSQRPHDEHCPKCKPRIEALLKKLYGAVESQYRLSAGVKPDDFADTPYHGLLAEIHVKLQRHRGFRTFTKATALPPCDFFVRDPGFILEFDESQHFTACRAITLRAYADDLPLGFDRHRWIRLCGEIGAEDNDPPYRDEQRAWYDTLRDIVPLAMGLRPTVRIFARDREWCALDPENPHDLQTFKHLVDHRRWPQDWDLEFRCDPSPMLGRLIIAGDWRGELDAARELLTQVAAEWPRGIRVECLATCGGFLQFDWPHALSAARGGRVASSEEAQILLASASQGVERLLDAPAAARLCRCARHLTLGVDSFKERISVVDAVITRPHVELVCAVDLDTLQSRWTGKSYPTPGQQGGLLRWPDLKSHVMRLGGRPVMILACHDLKAFDPRGRATTKKAWRRNLQKALERLGRSERPDWVLHHPHTTVKRRTWLNAWSYLQRALPSVTSYVGAGRYHEPERAYDALEAVLLATKRAATVDVIARPRGAA